MTKILLIIMIGLITLSGGTSWAVGGSPAQPFPLLQNMQRPIPQGPSSSLHSRGHCLYNWKIRDTCDDYYSPCYYDQNWGQWFGNCNGSLDTPGFSITVPNRIQK